MDASFGGSSTPSPWHADAVGGRPPHHPYTAKMSRMLMPGFAPMNASLLRRRAVGVELAIRVASVGSGDNRSVVRGGLRGRRRPAAIADSVSKQARILCFNVLLPKPLTLFARAATPSRHVDAYRCSQSGAVHGGRQRAAERCRTLQKMPTIHGRLPDLLLYPYCCRTRQATSEKFPMLAGPLYHGCRPSTAGNAREAFKGGSRLPPSYYDMGFRFSTRSLWTSLAA